MPESNLLISSFSVDDGEKHKISFVSSGTLNGSGTNNIILFSYSGGQVHLSRRYSSWSTWDQYVGFATGASNTQSVSIFAEDGTLLVTSTSATSTPNFQGIIPGLPVE